MSRSLAYVAGFGLLVAIAVLAAATGEFAFLAGSSFVLLGGIVFVAVKHNVPMRIGEDDTSAAMKLVEGRGLVMRRPKTFEEQVQFVLEVQDAVISAAPLTNPGIPLDQPRELSHFIKADGAMCFDRSRSIETILRLAGFKVRHLNVYSVRDGHSPLRSIIHPDDGTASHSISEVLTARGWMLVDSNFRYVGLNDEGEVFGVAYLQRNPMVRLHSMFSEEMPAKLRRRFTWVYGLYSRHGRFYPPYGALPDVNWRELLYNLTG